MQPLLLGAALALLSLSTLASAVGLVSRATNSTSTYWAYAPKPLPGRYAEAEADMKIYSDIKWDKSSGNLTVVLTVYGIDVKTNPITMVHLHPGSIYSESNPVFFLCGSIAAACKQVVGSPVTYVANIDSSYTSTSALEAMFLDSVDQLYVAVHTTLSYYPSPIRSQVFPPMSVYSEVSVTSSTQSNTLATADLYFPDNLNNSAWMWITFPNWSDNNNLTAMFISTDGTSSNTSSTIVYCFCGCKSITCPSITAGTRYLIGGLPRSGLSSSALASTLSSSGVGSSPSLSLYVRSAGDGSGVSKVGSVQKVVDVLATVGSDGGFSLVSSAGSLTVASLVAVFSMLFL